mmetsp:Transcript_9476/g.17184  ORF Transcript_9476/g.17184 Transcript_9476/m.17184 type:complete len:226 (-) Transcript_9476:1001-1678(-)
MSGSMRTPPLPTTRNPSASLPFTSPWSRPPHCLTSWTKPMLPRPWWIWSCTNASAHHTMRRLLLFGPWVSLWQPWLPTSVQLTTGRQSTMCRKSVMAVPHILPSVPTMRIAHLQRHPTECNRLLDRKRSLWTLRSIMPLDLLSWHLRDSWFYSFSKFTTLSRLCMPLDVREPSFKSSFTLSMLVHGFIWRVPTFIPKQSALSSVLTLDAWMSSISLRLFRDTVWG